MKPRILIAMHYMELGGAETSLIGLLHALDPERVDVDLFVYSHRGALMQYIPDWVNLLPEDPTYTCYELPMTTVLRRGQLRMLWARLRAKWRYRRYRRQHPEAVDGSAVLAYTGQEASRVCPDIRPEVEYDLAISYVTPHYFVLDHVRAKRKIAWIHTDYTRIDVDRALELPMWSAFDRIVSISDDVTRTFLQVFPSLADRILPLENILPLAMIRDKAQQPLNDPMWGGWVITVLKFLTIGRFSEQKNLDNLPAICSLMIEEMKKLLSMGRFCEAKNYDNVPDITRRIIESGCDIRWYIIGYGADEPLIRQKIAEAGMQEHVIILGKRENPYPYIADCDIYVQPSRYEGKSITVREAQVLCKPVVVTNYPTASSQIQNGVDGVIVPLDNEGCAKGLAEFIMDSEKQARIVEHLRSHDYAGLSEVEKIYDLLEL